MRQYWPYPYVSHLLLLPPDAAAVSFDLLCFRLAADGRRDGCSGLPMLPVRSGRLELGPPDPAIESRRGYSPWRALRGTLHPAGWWSPEIPVELQLLPWAATKSELALIAGPTRRPAVVGERRYLRLAHDVLGALIDALAEAGSIRDADLGPRRMNALPWGAPHGSERRSGSGPVRRADMAPDADRIVLADWEQERFAELAANLGDGRPLPPS